jgi:hypothetical protein
MSNGLEMQLVKGQQRSAEESDDVAGTSAGHRFPAVRADEGAVQRKHMTVALV